MFIRLVTSAGSGLSLTWTSLWRKRKYERRWTLSSGHGTAQTLRLEIAELLHEVGALHEGHVREVEVAQDLEIIGFNNQDSCSRIIGLLLHDLRALTNWHQIDFEFVQKRENNNSLLTGLKYF